jgi:hypothetical protein
MYLGWPQTVILLVSASQVVRATGVSYWCPAGMEHYEWSIAKGIAIACTGLWVKSPVWGGGERKTNQNP